MFIDHVKAMHELGEAADVSFPALLISDDAGLFCFWVFALMCVAYLKEWVNEESI